ncbi:calcium/calmodulin-dependent protein kinase type 1 [Aphelenchoides avenae]|nr:calcium/calmodulin-dependent protein kinase type 1 [Aphelenchus avenae]
MLTANRHPNDALCPTHDLNNVPGEIELSDSGLTLYWLLEKLWQTCPEFRQAIGNGRIQKVSCEDISENKGFVAKVYKTVLSLSNAPVKSFTVMIKVPTYECMDKLMKTVFKYVKSSEPLSPLVDVVEAHNVECKVYELIREWDCIPIPKVWHTEQATNESHGVLLMSDLAEHGVNLGFLTSLNARQVDNTLRHIVAFHAHLLCLSEEDSKRWKRIPSKRRYHIDDFAGKFAESVIGTVREYKTGEFEEMICKFMPATSKTFAQYALVDRPLELGLPQVLCHGDSGAHNMFFKMAADGSSSNDVLAFMDWQLAFAGNLMFDIARVIYGFCDPDVRRELERTIVECYFERLLAEMKNEGRTLWFGIEELREAYALAAVHQTVLCLCVPGYLDAKKYEYAPRVLDAWRHKFLLRAQFAVRDALKSLRRYAPTLINE